MAVTWSVPGILGDLFALALTLAPIGTMLAIRRNSSVGNRSVLNYIGTWFNAAAMVSYSLPSENYWVAGINSVALVAEFIYSFFYRNYAQGQNRRIANWGIVAGAVWAVILAVVYLAFFYGNRNEDIRVKLFGTLGALTTDVMYAAMLFDTYAVITTHDVHQQSIILLLAAVGNSISWTVFGLKPQDLYIEVPNAIGIALTGFELLVWIVVWITNRNNPPAQQNRNNPPAQLKNQPSDSPLQNQNEQPPHLNNQPSDLPLQNQNEQAPQNQEPLPNQEKHVELSVIVP